MNRIRQRVFVRRFPGRATRRASAPLHRARAAGLALLLIFLAPVDRPAFAETAVTVENRYNLISAFLYNFLAFTEWPEQDASEPFVIGVLGEDPFGRAAEAIARKTVDGRPVTFRFFERVEDLGAVHVLFIPRAQDASAAAACRQVRGRPVLTVGESDSFTREGGVIRFYEQPWGSGGETVLRVEINESAAEAAGLKFRSKLMRLAQLVRHPPPEGP